MKPPRIIYHPAPSPALDGSEVTPQPVDLGRDPRRALAWIRRRLGLIETKEGSGATFEGRRLPDAPSAEPRSALPATSAHPEVTTPQVPEAPGLSTDELLAALEADPRLNDPRRRD